MLSCLISEIVILDSSRGINRGKTIGKKDMTPLNQSVFQHLLKDLDNGLSSARE